MTGRPFPPTSQPMVVDYTSQSFSNFIDADKGVKISGMSEIKRYLHRFGYLDKKFDTFTDTFDDTLETAILDYQKKLGLPITGKLDSQTITQIMSPRCGVSDYIDGHGKHIHVTKQYTLFKGKPMWRNPTLTYAFSKNDMIDDYISYSDIQAAFKRSFARWASAIPVKFIEVENYREADIKIGFYQGEHGDGSAFSRQSSVIAHAAAPNNHGTSFIHFNKEKPWFIDLKSSTSDMDIHLESVAIHEIGHVLGLDHSSYKEAVMYPYLPSGTIKLDLNIDDIKGLQMIYRLNPDYKYTPSTPMIHIFSSGFRLGSGRLISLVSTLVLLIIGFIL